MGGTSRVSREAQARICERLGVKFPGPTRRWETGRRSGVCARAHPRLYKLLRGCGLHHLGTIGYTTLIREEGCLEPPPTKVIYVSAMERNHA